MYQHKDILISFEVYPPNTFKGGRSLKETCCDLMQLNPSFFSVTFGALGSSQLKTERIVNQFTKKNINTVPHISCVNMTRERLQQILLRYQQMGVKSLIVIRGDQSLETQQSPREYKYASDLVKAIRELTKNYFYLIVAAYPEFHPEAINYREDLLHFKEKVIAGADAAISQFFFSTDAYLRFRDSCNALDINIPIFPGIMPIADFTKLKRFAQACGAEIPLWLGKRLEIYEDNISQQNFGIEVITQLCDKLLQEGVKGLHFYTLNQINPTKNICQNLFIYQSQNENYTTSYVA